MITKREFLQRIFGFLLVVALILQITPGAFAHTSSLSGTFLSSSSGTIGTEKGGWIVDERFHTNGTTITYSFDTSDSYLTSTYKNYTTSGASKWSGTVTIVNKTDGSGTGKITAFDGSNTNINAQTTNRTASSSTGHLTSWEIQINRNGSANSSTLAHEFGHVIGLRDLYESYNYNKIMCGYKNCRTVTSPSSADKWGAKVITGVHTTHTWGYNYDSTVGTVNKHRKYCTVCGGLTTTVANCVYNSSGNCKYCGTPKGQSPVSVGKQIE